MSEETTERRTEYPEFEGPMKYKDELGDIHDIIVVGCNRAIGISIVFAENKDKFILCWHGPSSPIYKAFPPELTFTLKTWNRCFDLMIANMKNGVFWESIVIDIVLPILEDEAPRACGAGPTSENCPYNA